MVPIFLGYIKRECRTIESDLGGRSNLSCGEGELRRPFAGAALQYLNVQIALGEISQRLI
jgi:hypothetical protein